mmetsp:Transcript_34010/g.86280  ORF Transcript_34010/g.86280 Transcript_34010/m.86280 type:complete len:236 (-) Transcript_34010:4150-4857(-)
MVLVRLPVAPGLLQPLEVILVLDQTLLDHLPHVLEQILLVHVHGDQGLELGPVHLRTKIGETKRDQIAQHLDKLAIGLAHDFLVFVDSHASERVLEVLGPDQLNAEQGHLRDGLIPKLGQRQAVQDLWAHDGGIPALLADRPLHLVLQGEEPVLDVSDSHHRRHHVDALDGGANDAEDLHDFLLVDLVELHAVDGVEELLEVLLDALGVAALGEDLEQHRVGGEVEARELVALAF